jgi:hypothetical protein
MVKDVEKILSTIPPHNIEPHFFKRIHASIYMSPKTEADEA